MPKASEPSEADIIFNRASLALAKSQRLIESWLPPKTEEDVKTEEQLEAEEREIFTVVPERLGLGAPLPRDGEILSNKPKATDEKLRKQFLGKNFKNRVPQNHQYRPGAGVKDDHIQSKPRPKPAPAAAAITSNIDDDDDDNEGRSSLGRQKTAIIAQSSDQHGAGANRFADPKSSLPKEEKKRRGNYLDEVLLERAKKRNKGKVAK